LSMVALSMFQTQSLSTLDISGCSSYDMVMLGKFILQQRHVLSSLSIRKCNQRLRNLKTIVTSCR
jgi:hypothetical protein